MPLVGVPKEDPGPAGGILYPLWTGKASGSPQNELESVAVEKDV